MCQSLNTSYQFCGCTGATYEQRCSEPSPTCELLLARPTPVKLQCYCPKHSSQTFKSRVEGRHERERKRIDKEIHQILVYETPLAVGKRPSSIAEERRRDRRSQV